MGPARPRGIYFELQLSTAGVGQGSFFLENAAISAEPIAGPKAEPQ